LMRSSSRYFPNGIGCFIQGDDVSMAYFPWSNLEFQTRSGAVAGGSDEVKLTAWCGTDSNVRRRLRG
jgi:hypothetical protein